MSARLNVNAEFVKWVVMALALFWSMIFRLSQSLEQLPEFVYVNF